MAEIYRASTTAPVNIAVVKYWGKRDAKLNLPTNSSLSVTLSQADLRTLTTATCSGSYTGEDSLTLNGAPSDISGGGGLCGTGCVQNHFDLQVFSPPYLFNSDGTRATQPVIDSVSSTEVSPGASLTITTQQSVASFSLVRYGSATHTINTDQRRVPLSVDSVAGLAYNVTLPTDSGVLVPGYWMVFAIDSAGVPSIATTIKILGS
ncbi:hypothetical protein CHU98_g11383 [Xylaria longipes]|nr:hypothetical protein CHU98_g11383 [Xylaria longipes]